MKNLNNQEEINADNQMVNIKNRLKKIFNHDLNLSVETCPIKDILSVASDKWSILIILFLGGNEVLRFGELKNIVKGISSKILTERLKRLERDGYLIRKLFAEVPVRVEYKLSKFGLSYLEKLLVISEWAQDEMNIILRSRVEYDDRSQ
ncbi:helix-turn-helix transcriptional regulator [Cyclobacteriaceae bacterium]|nr:helix-turn-helix transcriptional regulator [Cyclobacteriaceae bacterium]MDB4291124.1 helix-turn-helix transcriptional regulator [Cyclobacteriaceae bacterium]MDC6483894.1 helix-turn-helix domain-containing protein [Cyclobacteriaceae bacterium]